MREVEPPPRVPELLFLAPPELLLVPPELPLLFLAPPELPEDGDDLRDDVLFDVLPEAFFGREPRLRGAGLLSSAGSSSVGSS